MAQVMNRPTVEKATSLERVLTSKPAPRIEELREAFLNTNPSVAIDRARIETRVMKETEGESVITRRAKVFAASAREMPIYIQPGQLLAGCIGGRPRCYNIVPGLTTAMRKARQAYILGLREDLPYDDLSEDEKQELEGLTPYWKEQGRLGKVFHYGHNIHNHEKVVKKGFLGIKRDAEERLARLDLADAEDAAKVPFLEGVILAMEAAAEVGQRFAVLAREQAEQEPDATRKAELLEMAEVCDRVPANPARTFREALQSYYISYLLLHWEVIPSMGFSQGRVDQCLGPYYDADIREGRITPAEAQELIDCYLNYEGESSPITVGGVRPDGRDATNELSYLIIEGVMHTRLPSPWLSVLVHSQMPDDLLFRACQLASLGTGQPQFVNNDIMVAQALARGTMGGPPITLEDARNSSPQGCFELVIPGKDSGYLYYRMPNLAACMEFVMTNGKNRSGNGKEGSPSRYRPFEGIETGDPAKFESFEEVQEAFRKQLAWMRRDVQIAGTNNERNIIEFTPTVYESALIEDCIEKGICREEGGAHYNFNNGGAVLASTDAGDSLTAIRKLVFEDRKITMAELCEALGHNFEGHEELHQMLLSAPKFGNDDDYADEQVAWVLHEWMSEFNKVTNLRGGVGCPGGSVMGAYVPEGAVTGALPSGRMAWEPLCDASSPGRGQDVNGPTAVVKSMGKIDNIEILGGITFNLRLDPAIFKDGDVERMAALVRTFVDQKIFHMQLNVVSSDTLVAAQKEPEKNRDLVVKVAGYNAFFTQLSKPLQDTIIARTQHAF
jgi:formate C-acetyltransferase